VGDLSALPAIAPERPLHRSRRTSRSHRVGRGLATCGGRGPSIANRHRTEQQQNRPPPHRRLTIARRKRRLVLEDAYGVCRSSLCVPGGVSDTIVRRCRRRRAGAWHRRQHGDLQHRQRGPAASPAFRGAGTPGADLHQDAGRSTLRALPRQVLRLAAGCTVVRGDGDVPMLWLQGARAHRHGHRANSTCDSCQRGLFRDRQRRSDASFGKRRTRQAASTWSS